jgi:DNA-binding FadR family transcriptional regulator
LIAPRRVDASELDDVRSGVRRGPKVAELVARQLGRYVMNSGFAVGTLLPVERAMLEILGVGRPALREALRLLESWGLIRMKAGPRGGPEIRHPVSEDLSDSLSLVLEYADATLLDLQEARLALEPVAARLAAARVTPEELEALERSTRLTALESTESFWREAQHFHQLIADASHSQVVRALMGAMRGVLETLAVGVVVTVQREHTVAEHQALLAALRSGDGDAAESIMREHLLGTLRAWQEYSPKTLTTRIRWSPGVVAPPVVEELTRSSVRRVD